MVDSLKLPEKTRLQLFELFKARNQAQKAFENPLLVALDFLGLDPSLNHQINFETGVITPAEPLTKPELVKEEAAS